MDDIPNYNQCIQILKENKCSQEIINHCIAVRNIAVRIAERANANITLVEAGALLHDIGRSVTHDIGHAVEGAKIAKKIGLNNEIINIIERHIGAGISKEEAKKIGLPTKDYTPQTLEEKIVCHSDNLIEDNKQQNIEIEVKKALDKGLKKYAEKLILLHEELCNICQMDINYI